MHHFYKSVGKLLWYKRTISLWDLLFLVKHHPVMNYFPIPIHPIIFITYFNNFSYIDMFILISLVLLWTVHDYYIYTILSCHIGLPVSYSFISGTHLASPDRCFLDPETSTWCFHLYWPGPVFLCAHLAPGNDSGWWACGSHTATEDRLHHHSRESGLGHCGRQTGTFVCVHSWGISALSRSIAGTLSPRCISLTELRHLQGSPQGTGFPCCCGSWSYLFLH